MERDSRQGTGRRNAGWPAIVSWVMFDWSTQPFFTLITTFVFSPYFASRLAPNPVEGQALWGYATAAAGLTIAFLSPVLGAVADAGGSRKPWIVVFSVLLVVASFAMWWAAPGVEGAITIALVAFAIGTVGAEFATVFTNAMMPDLVEEERLGRLSGTGWAVGYVGGLVSLGATLGFLVGNPDTGHTLLGNPPILGLDPARFEGDRASGPFTAIWYVIFVIPLFLFVPDVPRRMKLGAAARAGCRDLVATLSRLRSHGNAARYLIAHMIYTDGLVALFAFGAIYAAGVFGWSAIELGLFGILFLVTGTIGALVGGRLDDLIGPKKLIVACLIILIVASLGILSVDRQHVAFVIPVPAATADGGLFNSISEKAYFALGAVIGAIAGPLQSASRTLLVRVSPRERMTEFFGLYALSGKVTSFLGPLAVSALTMVSGSQRIGISILLVFFIAGSAALVGVKQER